MSGLAHDGLFRGGGLAQLAVQLEAVVTVGGFSFATSLLAWHGIKRVMGLRVSAEHELTGLDIAEMGMEAYPSHGEVGDSERAAPAAASPAAPTA